MITTRAAAAALAVALSGAVLLAGCGGPDARRANHMERGQEYFAAENFEKARVEFRNALQVDPKDAQAMFMSAQVAEKLGNVADAVRLYQSTIEADPQDVRAVAALGRMYVFAGAPERALPLVEPALVEHPDDADLLTVRGAARVQQKDREGALADAEHAVKLAPANENATALLASLYRQAGENGRAIELVKEAVNRVPSSVDMRLVLANLYLTVGDQGLADEQLREIVKLKPKELRYRQQLALSYMRAKKTDEAEKTLREAVDALPESVETKLTYVEFLASQGSPERGQKALEDFIAREPRNYELRFGLGALQQRNNQVDAALATYGKILEEDGDGVQGLAARLRIAAIHVAAKRFDEAATLVARVLQENPRDSDALILRGNIALERQDPASAIADLRAVLRDKPGAVGILRTLARAHVANNELALAEETLRSARESAPADVDVRIELAQLLNRSGRAEQAVALLEETVNAAPTNVTAREVLVRGYIASRDFDAARRAAEDLKLTAPTLAVGPYLAGLIAHGQKRYDDAQRELEKALQLQPTAMDALTALTRLEVERGRTSSAVARLNAAAEADAQNPMPRNTLGELYLTIREPAKAVEPLQQALKIAPTWWVAHRNLAQARLGAGDQEGAIAAYEAGIQATDHHVTLVTDLALLYERLNRIDDAVRQYEDLHERNPKLDLVANNLAMLLVTYRKDQASLDRARDLSAPLGNSRVGAYLDTHGWVRFKRGEINQALPVLERAAAEAPDSKVVRFHLGMVQSKAGQREQAISNLEKALDGGAGFTGAEEARITLAALKGGGAG